MKSHGLKLLAVLLCLLMLWGCAAPAATEVQPTAEPEQTAAAETQAPEETEAPAETQTPAAEPAELTYTPGTYTASARGYGGDVSVEVVLAEHAIESVSVDAPKETKGVSTPAIERVPAQIVEHQSLAIDAVSGCSMTTYAIVNAVADCVEQAGGDAAVLRAAEIAKEPREDQTYECDVLVIGGGISGTTAALEATDLGANVILVEKKASTRCGGDGFFAIDSRQYRDAGFAPIDLEQLYHEWMTDTAWGADANMVREWLSLSSTSVEFMESHNCHFVKALQSYSDQSPYAGANGFHQFDEAYGTTIEQLIVALEDVTAAGGKILTETEFTEFLLDENGNVCGGVCYTTDGYHTRVEIRAKSVINCAGGYKDDTEWMAKYNDGVTVAKNLFPLDSNGSVIKLCYELGAAERGASCTLARSVGTYGTNNAGFTGKTETTKLNFLPMILWINQAGERVANEYELAYNRTFISYSCLKNGGVFYLGITGKMLDILGEQGSGALGLTICQGSGYDGDQTVRDRGWGDIHDLVKTWVANGTAYSGNTVEELAASAGMDVKTLTDTYAEYNKYCEEGHDARFFKDAQYLYPQEEGPYYLIPFAAYTLTTLGGLRTSTSMEVVSFNETARTYDPIPNLYASGSCVGGIYGEAYANLEGPCMSFCFTSSRTAAVSAVNNALGTEYDYLDLASEAYSLK